MSGVPRPTTPTRRISIQGPPTPSTPVRLSSTYGASGSPAYATTTRRHSLYGTEDRIIIDPGSHVWKVGFSGEGKPRHVSVVGHGSQAILWGSTLKYSTEEREEADRILAQRLQDCLRSMFFDSLLADPKSRKVIIVEHPLLPLGVKDLIAQILFDNLSVPSISFAPSHLLALMAAGRTTGLVLDCGHLESVVLPIVSSRPMYPLLRTTPVAGIRFTEHLKQLILNFGLYKPPLATLGGSANMTSATQLTRVPEEILTDELVEKIKTECCFIGEPVEIPLTPVPAATVVPSSDAMSVDEASVPPSSGAPSESSPPSSPVHPDHQRTTNTSAGSRQTYWESIAAIYQKDSTTQDLSLKVNPPGVGAPTGRGTLIIPGWVREHAAEVLFEGGDVDESSVAEVILDCLMRAPLDLRKMLISSILIIGGTAMLPGFIPRLRQELARTLNRPTNGRARRYDPYAPLRSLASSIAIVNDPAPPPSASSAAAANAGKTPAFTPALFPWIGGSLAGALKTGGEEIQRERWDEAQSRAPDPDDMTSPAVVTPLGKKIGMTLPDWTRVPLTVGAPMAGIRRPVEHRAPIIQQEPVGA